MSVFAATSSLAQTKVSEFRLERFHFNSGARRGVSAASGDLLDRGQIHLLLAMHYAHNPLVLYVDGQRAGSLIGHRLTMHAALGYGITSWFHASLELPVVLFQTGDSLTNVVRPDSAGLSSPLLHARFGMVSQGKGGLFLKDAPIDVALGLAVVLPLATGSTLSRELGIVPQLSVGRDFGTVRVGGEVTAWVRPSNVVLTPSAPTVSDSVGHQLGVKLIGVGTVAQKLQLELSGHLGIPLGIGTTPAAFEVLMGVRYPVWLLELFALAGPGFGQLPGTPAVRAMLGANLAPKSDPCAPDAKHTPAECPDLDDDHDGLRNRIDRCPLEPEDADDFEDADGCVDPDDDADGVLDTEDACRLVVGVKENRGCPPRIIDTDKDGLEDKVDSCPTEPGPKERHGCPVRDADGDKVEDADDRCINEPGPVERAGCPIKDRDGDTVEDTLDNCPDLKGEVDNSGCPKAKKQLVQITREKLVIKDRIYFATGKAVILPKSFGLLDQIADVLNTHPEIGNISIEGHTDSMGKREANTKLSEARAASVRTYLMRRSVDSTRLKAIGYGPDRPADSNASEAGRANNRRVEFMIETPEKTETKVKENP